MADVCGPWTLDQLDAFGTVDSISISLDDPIWQSADTCVLDSSASISGNGTVVADGNGIFAFLASITGTGSASSTAFRTITSSAIINGVGSVDLDALRIRLSDGSVVGVGTVTALGNVKFSSSGSIVGVGSASLLAFAIRDGQGDIIGIASTTAEGGVIGEEWTVAPIGDETWHVIGDGICGPFTLDQLDVFGGLDTLPFSLDDPIYLRSDFCANADVWETVEQGADTWLRKG